MRMKNKKRIVLKLTGSLFDRGAEEVRATAKAIMSVRDEVEIVAVVTGGGDAARRYIEYAKNLGADQATLDEIGIDMSRINAKLFIAALEHSAYPYPPTTLEEAVKASSTGKVVVVGGFQPGQSTNAVAALLAERLSVSLLVNATDVEGVYDKDPKRYADARLLREVTVDDLRSILEGEVYAGTYDLMDPLALKIVERSKIPTRIIRCSLEALTGALEGRNIGTLIVG
jgi:uridylate kinase